MKLRLLSLVCLAALALGGPVGAALADGDPGSDVLVYQSLFVEADAGVSVSQQARLVALLSEAKRAGFPIRVAIVASRFDLGAVTELWGKPRSYARFLGLELSVAYRGRLLVVMPDGLGFNWPGHSVGAAYGTLSHISVASGGGGLAEAAQSAVKSLAAARGVKLSGALGPSSSSNPATGSAAGGASPAVPASSGSNTDTVAAVVAVALAVAAALALLARRAILARRRRDRPAPGALVRLLRPGPRLALGGALTILVAALAVVLVAPGSPTTAQSDALAHNPSLDPGTPLNGPAPDFTLTDEFGHSVSLHSFRGKVVVLAFNDSQCTTICPLTTTAMLDAKQMLGRAGGQVQLLGVDANPRATSLADVSAYSELHGLLHSWHFLTGSLPQLRSVWKAYHIEAAVLGGQVDHTPALFVIDRQGRLSRLFVTEQSYAAVGQLGQLLAQSASRLLPGHPTVHAGRSYSRITGISPTHAITLPRAGGGSLQLAPGHPRLYLFFATWDRQTSALAAGLEGLSRYSEQASAAGLPPLEAVDEGSVEPPGALGRFLGTLPHRLAYPVAVDPTGRVADGYEVQGLPWLVLVSATGRIAWYYSVNVLGWPSVTTLVARVKEGLARAAAAPGSLKAALAQLTGSPPALAALHQQAGQLLGAEPALAARIRALRGYPIVINAWASWCGPCRGEFGLFASASAHFGRQVAFLGTDTTDSAGDARSFLQQHPVSYPSYQMSMSGLDWLAPQGLAGLPSTIFVSSTGKLVYVHTGQYDSQGTLNGDIQSYAVGH